ncbi:MAG: hypothetical protein H2174_00790 [Vampirovibrio sp.]|nr:hypothetical protein [Vampirovibrio sp.]
MFQKPLNTPNRNGYGVYTPNLYNQQGTLAPSPWALNTLPPYGYIQPAVQQPLQPTYSYQQPDAFTTTAQPIYSAPRPPLGERVSNGFNAFVTGLVVDPITLAVEKAQQIATYPFKGKKEALISAGVATGTVVAGTVLGGYGFVLAPLALAGLAFGGRDAFRFLKSQFSDNQSTEQKDNSWRQLAHTVGVAGLAMSLGTAIGHTKIEGKPFIDFWQTHPGDTTGWKVLHNTPQLAWLDSQRTLNGIVKGENYSGFWTKLVDGAKANGTWLVELPKNAWHAIQR